VPRQLELRSGTTDLYIRVTKHLRSLYTVNYSLIRGQIVSYSKL
jgi:hypothetical protein